MTTDARPVFLRPVEYTYTGTAFTVGAVAFTTFSKGTFPNALSLAHSVAAAINNEGTYTIALSMSDGFLIGLTPSGASPTITWNDTTLRDILGFTGASTALSDGVTTYASYTTLYCWIPTFQRGDQDGFSPDLSDVATGTLSKDGTWSGISTGGTLVYSTTITFSHELETNLLVSSFDTDDQKRARCLESFLIGAVSDGPTDATYASPKGFWYYPDINDAISQCTLTALEPWAEGDDIGVEFDSDGGDTKVFCSTSPSQLSALRARPSMPFSTIRYGVTFSFQTCPAPTGWAYEDYIP